MIVLIAAMGENRIIGVGGELPWHLPRDLARFKQLTMGRPLIMGRRTFDSIGRPLPGRPNIVVTRNRQFAPPGVDVTTSPGEALLKAMRYEADEMFVIGGDEIYRQFLPLAQRIELSIVHDSPEGDTTFPELPSDEWIVAEESVASGEPSVTYQTLVRANNHTASVAKELRQS